MAIFSLALMFVLLFLGVPIALSLGTGAVLVLLTTGGLSLATVSSFYFENVLGFTLLAIPFFIFAGDLMLDGGLGEALIGFVKSWVGHLPGGLAIATVLGATLFGAMSGSNLATLAAIGSLLVPAMVAAGYKPGMSGGLLACCGALGNLIPPSLNLILLGMVFQISTAALFAADLIPGLIASALLVITAAIICKLQRYGGAKAEPWKARWTSLIKAIPAFMLIFIILGGIYGGVFTPTEAAAVSCVYAAAVGFFLYRKLTLAAVWRAVTKTIMTSCGLFFLIAAGMMTGKAFTLAHLPQAIAAWVLGMHLTPLMYFLIVGLIMLVLGTAFDAMLSPFVIGFMLFPAAVAVGVDIIQFAIFSMIGSLVAAIMPPVATSLYFVSDQFKVPLMEVTKGAMLFLIPLGVLWLLVALFPALSLWLPHFLGLS